MNNIYGVILKNDGKTYYFNGNELIIDIDGYVIVETERGVQFGKVVSKMDENGIKISLDELKDVIRIGNDDDYQVYMSNLAEAEKALNKAKEIALELKLNMNLIEASYTFDKKQLLFNFIADDRVDFRELARRLAGIFKTRIELRQIGARDKAKIVNGIGPCGRTLCCATFLNKMETVTMNMAKNQNISLNPTKINGVCGRLLCCLTYEDDEYTRCQKGLPSVGQTIKTELGSGRVVSVDILKRKYKVDIDGVIKEFDVSHGTSNK